MFIHIQRCERADINLEFALSGQAVRHLFIESVDSLDHQDIILSEFGLLSAVLPPSRLKVKGRQLYLLPCQKRCHILVELFHVQRFQTFKIGIAVLIPRRLIVVYIIIIQTDGMRF